MKRARRLLARAGNSLRTKKMFWRILLLYVVTSVALLTVFSAVLGAYLTRHATQDAIAHNREVLGRAYAAAEQVLNTTYDMYYKLYQSSEVSDLLFTESLSARELLDAGQLLAQVENGSDCVASVYLVNRAADRVIASDGTISGLDTFYDGQALRLFQDRADRSVAAFCAQEDFSHRPGRYLVYLECPPVKDADPLLDRCLLRLRFRLTAHQQEIAAHAGHRQAQHQHGVETGTARQGSEFVCHVRIPPLILGLGEVWAVFPEFIQARAVKKAAPRPGAAFWRLKGFI